VMLLIVHLSVCSSIPFSDSLPFDRGDIHTSPFQLDSVGDNTAGNAPFRILSGGISLRYTNSFKRVAFIYLARSACLPKGLYILFLV